MALGRWMYLVGIDPGLRGGVVMLERLVDGPIIMVHAGGIKVSKKYGMDRVDTFATFENMMGRLRYGGDGVDGVEYPPVHVAFERVSPHPSWSGAGGFQFGRAYGALEAAVAYLPGFKGIHYFAPKQWKASYGLGKDKEDSRSVATEHIAEITRAQAKSIAEYWPRKGDHGIAEAALLAAQLIRPPVAQGGKT